jgi:hypothetical protein
MHAQKMVGRALPGLDQTLEFVACKKHDAVNLPKTAGKGDKSIQTRRQGKPPPRLLKIPARVVGKSGVPTATALKE